MSKVQDNLTQIQDVITRRLKLKSPRFQLEQAGAKISGSIISASFHGMPDSERQKKIWDALYKEYGGESVQRAGTFLAFTPLEWDIDESA